MGDQNILKYKSQYENTESTIYFNAFNNSWGTNFPQWMGGDLVSEFRLIPHEGEWKDGNIYQKALEYKIPVMEVSRKNALDYLSWFEGLQGIEILAFKRAINNEGYVLRLHDITGEKHSVSFSLPDIFTGIAVCDLCENVTDRINGRMITFETQPFGIHSFFLKQV